jgi:RNA polymerase sigma factor (sigma-70 family)
MSAERTNFESFYREERGRMAGYVRRLVRGMSEADEEDIIQDVMLNVWSAADVTLPIGRLSSYIYQSLKNRVIDLSRKKTADISIDAPAGGRDGDSLINLLSDARYDIAGESERREISDMLFDALDMLKQEEREIIVMTEFEDRSFAECSEIFGEPVGTLLSRKSRALKKVRGILGESELYMED